MAIEDTDAAVDGLMERWGTDAPQERPIPRLKPGERESPEHRRKINQAATQLQRLFRTEPRTLGEKAAIGAVGGVATLAKAPEFAAKIAEKLGVEKGLIARHVPAITKLADQGRALEEAIRQAEDPRFAEQDVMSQLARGAGSMAPFAALVPLGAGLGGALAARVPGALGALEGFGAAAGGAATSAIVGAAQTAIPMFEDILHATGSEEKAWQGAWIGGGLGLLEAFGAGRVLAKLDRATAGSLKRALLRIAIESVEEGGQEFVQTLGQAIAEKKITDKEVEYLREALKAAPAYGIGALLGAGVSGGQQLLASGVEGSRKPNAGGKPTDVAKPKAGPGGLTLAPVHGKARTLEHARADDGGADFLGPPAGLLGPEDIAQPSAAEEPAAEGGPATEEEAARAILAGEDLPLETLQKFPKAIGRAIREREQLTPEVAGPAAGEGQPSATEAVQPQASTAQASGVSAEPREERRVRQVELGQMNRQRTRASDVDAAAQRLAKAYEAPGDAGQDDDEFLDAVNDARIVLDARRAAGFEPNEQEKALLSVLDDTDDLDPTLAGAEEQAATASLRKKIKALVGPGAASSPETERVAPPVPPEAAPPTKKPQIVIREPRTGKTKTGAGPDGIPELQEIGTEGGLSMIDEAEGRGPEATPEPTKATKLRTKEDEEAFEAREVKGARMLTEAARGVGGTAHEVFDELLRRHEDMPKLKARTSTSKEMQALSTPLPLAWAASRLAGIEPDTSVYEPTAGHGALLIDATPSKANVNELQEERAASLTRQGFKPTVNDATTATPPAKSVDVVIANPPFGKIQIGKGRHKVFPVKVGDLSFRTKEIDHAIALKSLEAMKDDGRAVLILGGKKPFGDPSQEARTRMYRSMEDQQFWGALYDNYNVKDHLTVAGKLYDRMGAAWPIDVVVIEGRKPTPAEVSRPFAAAPRILESWNDVRALIADERLAPGREPEADGGAAAGPAQPVESDVGGPARAAARAGAAPTRGERGAQPGGRVARPGTGGAEGAPGADVAELPAARGEPAPVGRGGAGGVAEERGAVGGGVEGARGDRPPRVAGPAPAQPARGLERVGEFQATYKPKSKGTAVGTLVPANMQTAIDRALERVEGASGGVDKFVADKLGYSKKELADYFSAEQVDALALAVSNLDEGAGFIIGDQTGVGKGRVVAGILRYAKRSGKIPVFVTAKPGLYADMRRDLADIGMPEFNAFITNTNLRGQDKLVLPSGETIESLPPAKHAAAMKAIAESKTPEVDAIFTTYDQQNPRAGTFAERSRWLKQIAPRAILVLDESHLAGGTETKPFFTDKEGNPVEKATRSELFRELVDAAAGVVYSSATYAKNPHVMTLYSRTDMGQAASREKLPELMKAGGVPLQQVIASMLTESGQYVRREKSFEGISMDMEVAESNRAPADRATELLGKLFAFDLQMKEVRDRFVKQNAASGGGVNAGDASVGAAGGKSGGFSSVMHNVVAQMLLSLKAQEVGRRAVAMFKSGRKPIVALSNTLEGLLADTVTDTGATIGDEIPDFTFGKIFDRYLERTRQVTIERAFSKDKADRVRIPDEDMGHALAEFEALKATIEATDLGDMPASPIDSIIHEMEKGGLKVGEITGRHLRVSYDEQGRAILAERRSSAAARKKAGDDFNSGEYDALIINKSGAEGISLHASPKNAKDVRPRHMFLVQADPNIDTFMQMLGRVNRTGQTSLPSYTVLVSDLPSEKRPAAILMKKMASLNANTSAARGSAVSLKNVVDFMNAYGDQTVAEVLVAEPDVVGVIGLDDERVAAELKEGNLARRVTGLLPLLPIDRQADLLDQIEANYTSRLEEAKASGENLLEAQVLDLKARTLSKAEISSGDGTSPFTRPAILQEAEVSRYAKPLNWEAVQARARKIAGIQAGEDVMEAGRKQAEEHYNAITAALEEERKKVQAAYRAAEEAMKDADPADRGARLETIKVRFTHKQLLAEAISDRLSLLRHRAVTVVTNDDNVQAYVVGIEAPTKGNLLAPSRWGIVIAPAEGDAMVKLPISRLMATTAGEDGYIALEPSRQTLGPEDFAGEATERREKRWIVTGNLLAGFEKFDGKGQIVFFTDESGAQHEGILLKRGAQPKAMLASKPVVVTAEQAIKYLDKHGGFVESDDGAFRISSRGAGHPLHFIAKTKGGKAYYLHKGARAAIGDYVSRRGKPEWEAFTDSRAAARKALDAYATDLGTVLQVTQGKDKAREITGEKLPELKGEETAPDIREAMAFPGQLVTGEEVRGALDAIARKLGYIRNQKALEAGVIPTETWTERQIRKIQDSFRGVKTTQAIVGEGQQLDEEIDAYLTEELRRGKTKDRLTKVKEGHWDPMLQGLRKDGISPEEAGEVLMARAAPDRNRIILERDPTNEAGSGMTDDEAAEIVDRALTGKRAAGFERLFERFDAMIAATRQGWVGDGLKTQEEVAQLAEEQPFYAPMRSDLDEDSGRPTLGIGRGVDTRGRPFKKATGRHTRAEAANVLAYAFTQAEQAAIVGEKTRVVRSFGNMIRANEHMLEDFAEVGPTLSKRAVVNGKVRWVHDYAALHADNVVAFWEGGKLVPIRINRRYQNVADALKNLGADNIGPVLGLARAINRWIVAVNLTYNPVFPLRNAIRDAAGALINSTEHGLAFAARTIRDVPMALWALSRHKMGKGGEAKWDAYVREYQEAGAPVAFIDILGFNQHLKTIENDARAQLRAGSLGQVIRGFRDIGGAIRATNEVVENGVRLSAYVHAREDLGMTPARAASWSKNLTVNFERKGDYGATINTLYLFANAGIQSTARVGQAVKHPAVRRLLAAGFFGLMAWDQIQRVLGGKDDDGEDFWDKIPEWEKRHGLVFMYPGERGRHFVIPTPFVYDIIQTMAQQLSGAMSGDVKPGAAMGEILSAGVEAFDPIGSGQVTLDDPASFARLLSPTFSDPLVELATNRDWKGTPIAPHKWKERDPDSENFWPSASHASVAAAKWLNRAFGGDEFESGAVDVSPETLEHWTKFLSGGVGRVIGQLFEVAAKKQAGELIVPRDVPGLSSFLVDFDAQRASTEDFKKLHDGLSAERDRAIRDKKMLTPELFGLWKTGNLLDTRRGKERKRIEAMKGDDRKKAELVLAKELQEWNARAREALLTTGK